MARSLHFLADSVRDNGKWERATELLIRSIEILRARGLGSGRAALHSLGDLSPDRGDVSDAARYYRQALALGIEEEDGRHCAYCLAGLACVAARNHDAIAAGRLWTLAEQIEHDIGFRMLAAERGRYVRSEFRGGRKADGDRAAAHQIPTAVVRNGHAPS